MATLFHFNKGFQSGYYSFRDTQSNPKNGFTDFFDVVYRACKRWI